MARPKKQVSITVLASNIMTEAGHLYEGDTAEISRKQADEILKGDKAAGRADRIKINEVKREAKRAIH